MTTPTTIHTPDGFIPQAPDDPPYLTLRDWFAANALIGSLASSSSATPAYAAFFAYEVADAMLKARGQ